MSNVKHTPGPWHVANGCQIRGAKDQIAKAWMMRNGEGLANAKLIAAAPELLEALEEAVACGMVPISSATEGGAAKYSRQAQVADMIRAAIAKAKGEA